MFGLINDGFRPMRLDDIEALIKELLTERFLNIDTSAESVVGQLVGISAKLRTLMNGNKWTMYILINIPLKQ